jgi:L-fuculose-phosphate aldolase
MILGQFQSVGRGLFTQGLVSSHSGNLSIRMGENLIITRRGSQLGSLGENDLIETGICHNTRTTPLASSELPVHRAIYRLTNAQAIVHAHPPHAVALSLSEEDIVCPSEGLTGIGRVPVLGRGAEIVPGALADAIAETLKTHRIMMVYGHGSFAIGQLLEEAYGLTTDLEAGCQVSCLLRSLRIESPKESRL